MKKVSTYFTERANKQYFIDRRGKCHKYKGSEEDIENTVSIHYEIARKIFPDAKSPDDVLMKLGWIIVGSTVYNVPIIHKRPTQSQINTLYDLDLYDVLHFQHDKYYINYSNYEPLCDNK